MRRFGYAIGAAAVLFLPMVAEPAHAGLIGDTVELTYYKNGSSSATTSGAVPQSVSIAFGFGELGISDTELTISNPSGDGISYSPGTFSVEADILSGPAFITGVSIDSSTNVSGVIASLVSFTSTSVDFVLTGLTFDSGQSVVLDLQTSSVPEPASIVLFLSGLFGLRMIRRRLR